MWKTLIVGREGRLTLDQGWLVVTQEEKLTRIPIEDLYSVVIDNRQSVVSISVLTALSDAGVHVMMCDEKHVPSNVLLPLNRHYRAYGMLRDQLSLSATVQEEMWGAIVRAKIENQVEVLRLCGVPKTRQEPVAVCLERIIPGDKRNVEAMAAKRYFQALFGQGFHRTDEDVTNAALNYGYSILRSAMARSLCAYGFHCELGIHHIGEGNPFNLADDLMEPWRPLVDYWTDEHMDELFDTLTTANRRELVGIVNRTVLWEGKKTAVRYAIDRYAAAFSRAVLEEDVSFMHFPKIIALNAVSEEDG